MCSLSHWPSYFFFSLYAHHRDLHSFPTRRSSDLRGRAPADAGYCARAEGARPGVPHGSDRRVRFPPNGPGWRVRSEEHTSELQSQSNLVCRLLLEKKKKKRNKEEHRNRDRYS